MRVKNRGERKKRKNKGKNEKNKKKGKEKKNLTGVDFLIILFCHVSFCLFSICHVGLKLTALTLRVKLKTAEKHKDPIE